jgi:hypothetical protein
VAETDWVEEWGLYWRVCGAILFAISYFLPACRGHASGSGITTYLGYECVLPSLWFLGMMLEMPFAKRGGKVDIASWSFLLGMGRALVVSCSGFLNAAAPAYFIATLVGTRRSRVLAIAVIAFVFLALSALLLLHFTPLVGFYLWISGALIALMPELGRRAQPTAKP